MSLAQYFVDNFWAAALMIGIIVIAWMIFTPVVRPSLPGEGKFGLKLIPGSGSMESYEGEVDGVRVHLEHDGDWTVTLEADCASAAELFAHRPMAAFDRPMRALFGPLRRLETPAAYGKGWAFYGSPAASTIVSRLPGPSTAVPWSRIELGAESLTVTIECDGKMSLERLREQAAAFLELLGAVRG